MFKITVEVCASANSFTGGWWFFSYWRAIRVSIVRCRLPLSLLIIGKLVVHFCVCSVLAPVWVEPVVVRAGTKGCVILEAILLRIEGGILAPIGWQRTEGTAISRGTAHSNVLGPMLGNITHRFCW